MVHTFQIRWHQLYSAYFSFPNPSQRPPDLEHIKRTLRKMEVGLLIEGLMYANINAMLLCSISGLSLSLSSLALK